MTMSSAPADPKANLSAALGTGFSTHFEVFGLPVRYAIDLEDLERRYREASRHWHPDRFGRAPAAERAAVLQRATDLNQAYRVLKSDDRRAEYLLKLRGVDLSAEESGKQPAMEPSFLMEVLELREELFEARAVHDRSRLGALKHTVETHMAAHRAEIAAGFARLEAGDHSATGAITQTVLEQRYHRRFLDEIAAQEDADAESDATSAAPDTSLP
jgi:molecular chaperone HscB